jgi:hypothetical protein
MDYKAKYEQKKKDSEYHFGNVMKLSMQIGRYRSIINMLLIDLDEKDPIVSIEYRKERVKRRLAELEMEFDKLFSDEEN